MSRLVLSTICLLASAGVGGCTTTPYDPAVLPEDAEYLRADVTPLEADLIQVQVDMTGARAPQDVADYADCTIAGYALSQDQNFIRLLRANFDEDAGLWSADAVYSISSEPPRGMRILDADVTTQNCTVANIPTG